MRRPKIHIIGAGFSGLSAAAHLAAAGAADIIVHERGAHAGGRRRSFFDETLGLTIDSGNYLIMPSWRSTLAVLDIIGAREQWREADVNDVAFADMSSGERWTLRPNSGRLPWWVLSERRRAPRTTARDYWNVAKLRNAPPSALVADFAPSDGPAAERLWRPFAIAALNIDPARASARLAASVLGEVFARGGRGARMMFPAQDFARAFVEPALKYLRKRGVALRFERTLRALAFEGERVAALDFEHDRVDLAPGDGVILATPPWVATGLIPGLVAPTEFTATLTAHFAHAAPSNIPRVLGVIHGPFPWMFGYPDRISVSVGDAGALIDEPREKLAADYWRAIAGLTGLSDDMPAWRFIRQKRAAFAATPEQDALRPQAATAWRNVWLAGAYTQTGLPETMESATRSGEVAAGKAMERA